MYELLNGFEGASRTYAKTAAEYIDKIVEQGNYDRLNNDVIRKLINSILTRVGYTTGHIRKIIAENKPELIQHKFANKRKPQLKIETKTEAIKTITSSQSPTDNNITSDKIELTNSDNGTLPQEVTNLVHYGNEEPVKPEPELKVPYKNKTHTELRLIIKDLRNKLEVKNKRINKLDKEIEKLRQEVDRLKAKYEPEDMISLVQLVSRSG